MKKKTLVFSIISLTVILLASSTVALTQAWWFQKPEYVAYDFKAVFDRGTRTLTDISGAPNVIIYEGMDDNIVEMNITIDDKVYYYPDDFDYQDTFHLEFSAITGEGFFRAEATITFKLPGKPTITDGTVNRVSNFPSTPTGPIENAKLDGQFKLDGTKRFALVDGFGLTSGRYLPNGLYVRHFGLIKGWPL